VLPFQRIRQVVTTLASMRMPFLLALTALLAGPVPASAQRLPTIVSPEHYDLAFVIDLAKARFSGTETIRVQVAEPTARIVLHAVEMQVTDVTVGAGASAQKASVTADEASQTITLTVPHAVPKGTTEIHTRFAAALNNQLRGLYLSKTDARS